MQAEPAPTSPAGDARVATVAELASALAAAEPGARILVAAGDYGAFHAANVRGEPGRPIVVAAADRAAPPVFRGGIQLSDVAHLELEGLAIVGAPANGLNLDDEGTFETPSHHVVLRELVVQDCGGRANHDGLKLSGVDDFRIERCTIERWGRGGSAIDLVGCHRGVVEACTLRDSEQAPAASGVQAKGGSSELAIRLSRFEHAGQRAVNLGGSTGLAYFRPRPEGFEARDVTVEGCTFVGSLAPIAFVGVDGATVRFNTFHLPEKWVARILQETREPGFVPCRNGRFTDNLVVYRASEVSTPINVGPDTRPESFEIARNYWYCVDRPERAAPQLPVVEREPSGGRDPSFVDAAHGDFTLAPQSPARAHGATALPKPVR
ncbi:MAG: right-handed parallel beta-helix repeat-containing protein [Planctomycetes bacterium]|nr:right-handed parallel beta-helix repeat-containing protein [Planctomycetota bacterium]